MAESSKLAKNKLFGHIWDGKKHKVLIAIMACDLRDGTAPEDYKYRLVVTEGKDQREVKIPVPKEKGKTMLSVFPLMYFFFPSTSDTALRITLTSKETRGEHVFEQRMHDVDFGRPFGGTFKLPVYLTKKGKDTGALQEEWGSITAYAVYSRLPASRPISASPNLHYAYKPQLEKLQTGDLIIYSGTGPGATISKVLSATPFGHVGIVAELANRWTEEPELYVFELTSNINKFFDPFKDKADPGVNAFRLCERIHQYWDRGDMWVVALREALSDDQKVALVQWVWGFHQKNEMITSTYAEHVGALHSVVKTLFPELKDKLPFVALLDMFSATFAADALRAAEVPSLKTLNSTTWDAEGRLNPSDLIHATCFRTPVPIRYPVGKKPPPYKLPRSGSRKDTEDLALLASSPMLGTRSIGASSPAGSSRGAPTRVKKRSKGSIKEKRERQRSESSLLEVLSAGSGKRAITVSVSGPEQEKVKTPGPGKRRPHGSLTRLKGSRQSQSMQNFSLPVKGGSPGSSPGRVSSFRKQGSKRVSRIGRKAGNQKRGKSKDRNPSQEKLHTLNWPMCQRVCETEGLKWDDENLRDSVESLVARMRAAEGGIPTAKITFKGKEYRNCFLGCDAVDWISDAFSLSREETALLGNEILVTGLLYHISRRKGFMDDMELYKFSGNEAEESGYVRDIFGASLEDIMDAQAKSFPDKTYPLIAEVLVNAVKRTGGFEKQGTFRLSTLMTKMEAARKLLNGGDYDSADSYDDPHLPASLLKQWLRELPNPVIPESLYEAAINCDDSPEARQEILAELSGVRHQLLNYLMFFLVEMCQPHHVERTKMDADNLTTVFTPCLMRCSSDDPIEVMKCMPLETHFIGGVLKDALDSMIEDVAVISELRSLSLT